MYSEAAVCAKMRQNHCFRNKKFGNFGDLVYIYVTTKAQGGEGIAQVTATVGDYVKYGD